MSDINDDLRDLFKNIEENRPEPKMPTSQEIYDKYTSTFLHTPVRSKLKIMFAAAPLALAGAALVATVVVISNSSTPKRGANYAASPSSNDSTSEAEAGTAAAKPSGATLPSAAVQSSGVATEQSSSSVSVENETRSEYIEVYSRILDTLSGTENGLATYNVATSDYEKVSDYSKLNEVRSYVSLAKSLYENDTFPITNSVIEFECDYKDNNITYQENLMYLRTKSETDYFEFELYGNSIENGQVMNGFYLNLSIEYDYEMNTLNSYNLYYLNKDNILVVNKYENKELYEVKSPTNDMVDYCNKVREEFSNELNGCSSIGDYSKEYKESIDSELGKDYFLN